MTEDRFSLKDHLFNQEKVAYLAELLSNGIPGFDRVVFEASIKQELSDLELKQRMALIARRLADHLDPDFDQAARQILRSLPPPLDPTLTDDDFGDFIFAPLGIYVADHGLGHFETSMGVLKELTKRFSMEGPIRPFLESHQAETLARFEHWARDENYHVRRLVSESTRPALPWAPRIHLPVDAALPLLDILHSDRTRYVTRSVANHLNDITKIDPSLVFDRIRAWRELGQQNPDELEWMTRHSLRTLVKRGHPTAMELLGYPSNPEVEAHVTVINPQVRPGETLEFSVSIRAERDVRLMVDYIIDFVKKSGATSPRTFKLKKLSLQAGETIELLKRHPLRANATTYKLYAGAHHLTVLANGKQLANYVFEVVDVPGVP